MGGWDVVGLGRVGHGGVDLGRVGCVVFLRVPRVDTFEHTALTASCMSNHLVSNMQTCCRVSQ